MAFTPNARRIRSGETFASADDNLSIRVPSGVSASVYLSGSFNRVDVEGRLFGHIALTLGDELSDQGNRLHVGASGQIDGRAVGAILRGSGQVENAGKILSEKDVALFLVGTADQRHEVVNRGAIHGAFEGIFAGSFEGVTNEAPLTLLNTGTIEGVVASLRAGTSADRVTNKGLMLGDVLLGDGGDRFDNRGGQVRDAVIELGSGDDVILLGAGAENVIGGEGVDTLDFRSGGALRVSLVDPSLNTGRAGGDRYEGIERILGSKNGTDRIWGDADSNTLEGLGGNDWLSGGNGNDLLAGGTGADRLFGGEGDDAFVFRTRSEGGDRILDWSQVDGNDDQLWIDASGFGGGLQAGASLADAQFAEQSTNVAGSDEVRFIFRTSDSTLWFDADGKGGAAAALVVELPSGATITSVDILLV